MEGATPVSGATARRELAGADVRSQGFGEETY